jgi:uncharacterized protein (TIGR03435 family)
LKAAALLLSLASLIPAQAKAPAFEVASIKLSSGFSRAPIHFGPDSVKLTAIDLRIALILAYGVRDFQIAGPDWLRDNSGASHFTVDAKAAHAVPEDQLRLMLRPLLADRFHLTLHHEQREMPVIALRSAGSGVKLKPTSAAALPDTQWLGFPGVSQTAVQGHHVFVTAPLEAVAAAVGICTGNALPPVVDQTNLKDRYDFTLRNLAPPPPDAPAITDDDKLAACGLIAEQDLGLTLNRAKAPVDILVIDHADKVPTEN